MPHYVYILYSEKFDKFYIGQTKDLNQRLRKHNNGQSRYTKPYGPWKIVHSEKCKSRSEGVTRERYLKSFKDKKHLRRLINQSHSGKTGTPERAT